MLHPDPLIACLIVIIARVIDVSIGTFRTILVMRGHKYYAALAGFVELCVWIFASGTAIKNIGDGGWHLGVSYALGFSLGNIVGMTIESKIALGQELVRVVSSAHLNIAGHLRTLGYRVTEMHAFEGEGLTSEVLLIIEKRSKVPKLLEKVREIDPKARYSTEDIKSVYDGEFGPGQRKGISLWRRFVKKK
jgi:uncharacterized protein YebE (UPF0316 family)